MSSKNAVHVNGNMVNIMRAHYIRDCLGSAVTAKLTSSSNCRKNNIIIRFCLASS